MFRQTFVIIIFILFNSIALGQEVIGSSWQFGIGGGLVKFSDKDALFIGDKHLMQVPRLNATKRINNLISIDGAVSIGSFDTGSSFLVKNNIPYLSIDVSGRFRYLQTINRLDPYIFAGFSYLNSGSDKKYTPTANVGTGLSYWVTDYVGLSSQVYYKRAIQSLETRSHLQFTAGLVFGLNVTGAKRHSSSSCYYNLYKTKRRRRKRL